MYSLRLVTGVLAHLVSSVGRTPYPPKLGTTVVMCLRVHLPVGPP